MDITDISVPLETHKLVFENLLINIEKDNYLWRPQPEKWCFLEIVCHLLDEECDDFRVRTKQVLENPALEMPSISPETWVLEQDYLARNYTKAVADFLVERTKYIRWLQENIKGNWENTYQHPKLGAMSAKLFLTNWLAHDYLHIHQITHYNYLLLKEKTAIDLHYAGHW
jgi:hypothetical protein